MNKRISFLFCFLFLSACAGTQSHLRILEADGTIRTDIADAPSYDYKVFIKNAVDFGWNGGKEKDRIQTVNLMFKDSCERVEVIDQIPIKTGEYLTGKNATTWVMKVRCEN